MMTVLSLLAVGCAWLDFSGQAAAPGGDDFPMVDYHVHLKGGMNVDEAKAWADARGMKYGIAENCGVGNPVTDDAGLLAFLARVKDKGVYVAMQAEGREWVKMFSPEVMAQFDYVFTDSMTWRDDKGRRMRLWLPFEVHVDDPQDFMGTLVDRTVWILENEPIDIYVNPTFLPDVIADRYDELWTEARMDRVITAAIKNDVAIEINARRRIPSPTFLKRAKRAGATFAFGTNNRSKSDLGNLEYCREMIVECGLTPDDMFVPKPDGQKAIQLKPLPKCIY
jgi:histidinol phosphatase-like PHP family hydrolase